MSENAPPRKRKRRRRRRRQGKKQPPKQQQQQQQQHLDVAINLSPEEHLNSLATPALHVDGSLLEGGGQVLRNCVAYAALQRRAICIENIRANRAPRTGLRPQHMRGVELVARLVQAQVSGLEVGSSTIVFVPPSEPVDSVPTEIEIDTGTAASICLLIQIVSPVAMLLAPARFTFVLRGGTNATRAPTVDYAQQLFVHYLSLAAPDRSVSVVTQRRGFFPRGGGCATLTVENPSPLTPLPPFRFVERGNLTRIHIQSIVCGRLPLLVAEKLTRSARSVIDQAYASSDVEITDESLHEDCATTGAFILCTAYTSTGMRLGASGVVGRKDDAVDVGAAAARELCEDLQSGGCLDRHMQDQLIIYMALAAGDSEVLVAAPVSLHTQTAIHWAQVCTSAKFSIEEQDNGRCALIRCSGSHFQPSAT